MEIIRIENGPMAENCYLITNETELLIVDPGSSPQTLKREIEKTGKTPIAILLTHAHVDHIGALDTLAEMYQIPFYVSEKEKEFLTDPSLNLSQFFGRPVIVKTSPLFLPKDSFKLGKFEMEIRETPGHSVGGVTFVFPEFAVVGDTLFYESIGRTDFPTGDYQTLINSIKNQLFTLPAEMPLYPGHGEKTNIRSEAMYNPFLQEEV